MVHSSKLLPILFLCLSRRDSRLTLSQPLDSRLTVWHHSNVEILFCCVPTSPAIGATEMRTVVFDCFSDVSEFRTAQTECINISTYEHTSQQLRMAGSKKCHFSETHFRVLKRWKFSSTKCQVPATVAQDCCAGSIWVKISAINTSYHISYIIFIYIYISTNFPDFPLMVFWNYQNDQNVLGFGDIRRLHCLSHHRVRLLWLNCQLCRAQSFWKKWVCPSDWTHVLHQANCQFPFVMLGEFSASHKMCEMTNDTGGFDPIWGSVKRMVKKCWTVTPFNIGTRGQSNQHTGVLWHILMKMGAQWVGTRFNDQNTFMIIKSY